MLVPQPGPQPPLPSESPVQLHLYTCRAGPEASSAALFLSSRTLSVSPLPGPQLPVPGLPTLSPEPSSALGAFLHSLLWSSLQVFIGLGACWRCQPPLFSPLSPELLKDRMESLLLPPVLPGFPEEWGLHKALQGRRVKKNVLSGTTGDGFFSVQNLCVYLAKSRPQNSPMK